MREPTATLRDNLVRGLRIAWDAQPRAFVVMTALAIVTALISPLVIWLGKRLVDQIVSGAGHAQLAELMPGIALLGIAAAADRALSAYRASHQELFSRRVERHAMHRFLAKAGTVDLAHYDDAAWHDRMERARRDVNWRPAQLSYSIIGLVASSVSVVGVFGLLATLHPLLLVMSAASVVPAVAIQRRTNRRIWEFHHALTPADRERFYMSDLLSSPNLAKEVRGFGLADHLLGRYARLMDANLVRLAALYRRGNLSAALAGLAAGAALVVTYAYIGGRGLAGELTAGDLTAAIGAFAVVTSQTSLISSSIVSIELNATFLDDYFAFLAVESLIATPAQPTELPAELAPGLVLDGVEFTYPRGTKQVLARVDLEVRPGELVALVGDNGAGKSTIVNLIHRFYDPSAGAIRIGGVDLREVDPLALRARIGVLFQDFARYELTARENVALGRVTRDADDPAIITALEAARAHALVDRLGGLDARLGRLFDGGTELSGGEWQRIAIARLMFRSADLWILDEPTSNLDPEAEAAIFAELKAQLAGRMAIVISHRFSTVRSADRIYVLGDGRVLESGTHEQLVAARGRYAELFEIQAAGYR